MKNAHDLMQQLAGNWHFVRKISGIKGMMPGTAAGKATLSLVSNDKWVFNEEGVFTNQETGQQMRVRRSFFFQPDESTLAVYFADSVNEGKLFHQLHFEDKQTATASHQCGKDHYQTDYQFISDDQFFIRHVVTGTRKIYQSETVYTRCK